MRIVSTLGSLALCAALCSAAWATDYVGCFRDGGDPYGTAGRDMSGLKWGSDNMTGEACVAYCREHGYAYAATQYSDQCFCDNDFGSMGPADNCNMPCSGSPTEICGGSWANTVYTTGSPPDRGQATPSVPAAGRPAWTLMDVAYGPNGPGAEQALQSGRFNVDASLSDDQMSGTVTVRSSGYTYQIDWSTNVPCTDIYTFNWSIDEGARELGRQDAVAVHVQARYDSTANGNVCDGSNNGVIVAHGNEGRTRPAYLQPPAWEGALVTLGASESAWGWGDRPHAAWGRIEFPQWIGDQPEFASFAITLGVSNPAGGILEYSTAYIYRRR